MVNRLEQNVQTQITIKNKKWIKKTSRNVRFDHRNAVDNYTFTKMQDVPQKGCFERKIYHCTNTKMEAITGKLRI